MSNNYTKISLSILVGLFVLILFNFDITSSKDTEKFLEHKYKSEYCKILDYTDINILGLHLINPIYVDRFKVDKDFKGTTRQKIISMISYINSFPYNRTQGQPKNLTTQGGNCQAKSLYFKVCLDNYNIPNRIEHNNKHMFNVLEIDGKEITIDLTNGEIKGGNLYE